MYRTLIPLLLCASALSAPQQTSNITYVKRFDPELSQTEVKPIERESRIEKIPLTIPSSIDIDATESINKKNDITKTGHTNKQPTYNYSDRIYSIKTKAKTTTTTTSTERIAEQEEVNETESNISDVILSKSQNSDIAPAESIISENVTTNDSTGLPSEKSPTQSDEYVTENYEDETTVTTTVAEEEITKTPTPRHLPKLSYFEKSNIGSFSQNLITYPGKRRFRSRCRCEKIWNCAKLQISVPRCPEEYFMCCS